MIEFDAKTLGKIMLSRPDGDCPNAFLAGELNRIGGIEILLKHHKQRIEKIKLHCLQDIQKVEHQIQTIQDQCKHESQTYHPDPSGGRDSMTQCNICGKELP